MATLAMTGLEEREICRANHYWEMGKTSMVGICRTLVLEEKMALFLEETLRVKP